MPSLQRLYSFWFSLSDGVHSVHISARHCLCFSPQLVEQHAKKKVALPSNAGSKKSKRKNKGKKQTERKGTGSATQHEEPTAKRKKP